MSAMKIKIKLKFTCFLSILSIFVTGEVSAEECMSVLRGNHSIGMASPLLSRNGMVVIAAKSPTSSFSSFPIGSGVVYRRQGSNYFVVTANHVVSERERYFVEDHSSLLGPRTLGARVIRRFPELDIAILKFVSDRNISLMQIGRSSNLDFFDKTYLFGWKVRGKHSEGKITEGRFNRRTGNLFNYSNDSYAGMSGGAILDNECNLVGIHTGRNIIFNDGQGIMVDSIKETLFPRPVYTFYRSSPPLRLRPFQIYAP